MALFKVVTKEEIVRTYLVEAASTQEAEEKVLDEDPKPQSRRACGEDIDQVRLVSYQDRREG